MFKKKIVLSNRIVLKIVIRLEDKRETLSRMKNACKLTDILKNDNVLIHSTLSSDFKYSKRNKQKINKLG